MDEEVPLETIRVEQHSARSHSIPSRTFSQSEEVGAVAISATTAAAIDHTEKVLAVDDLQRITIEPSIPPHSALRPRSNSTTSSSYVAPTSPSLYPDSPVGNSCHSPRHGSRRRRFTENDANEAVALEHLQSQPAGGAYADSLEDRRGSEDDDLERGVQELTMAMMGPGGSVIGMDTDEAVSKLITVAKNVLKHYHTRTTNTQHFINYISFPSTSALFLAILGLLAFYIYGTLTANPPQFRLTGTIVEVGIMTAVLLWNAFLNRRDQQLRGREVRDRVKGVIQELETIRLKGVQELKIPSIPSVGTVRVIRSGVIRTLPSNLIVAGDRIDMVYGDVAPCRVVCTLSGPASGMLGTPRNSSKDSIDVNRPSTQNGRLHPRRIQSSSSKIQEFFLERGQIFQSDLFGSPPTKEMETRHLTLQGLYTFEVLETPLENILHIALDPTPRPQSLLQKQFRIINGLMYRKVLLAVFLLAFLINLLRYVLKEVLQLHQPSQGVEQLLALPIYAALPLLPLSIPTLLQISKAYTNATILVLFNTLQISKTEYEDEQDVDEFDVEAPPPTKNVDIARTEVWRRFWRLLTRWGKSDIDFDDGLTRSSNLVESLGGITVICSIDKEGTIAGSFPEVEQILLATEEEDMVVLDTTEDDLAPNGLRFEDKDWEQYIQSLKPIGLNQLLNTNCASLQPARRQESHRKCNGLHLHSKNRAAQQTCLCRVGREIGFTEEALYPFSLQKEIFCYHPYFQANLDSYGKTATFEIPSMLSTVYHDQNSDGLMLLTDGHVECVVECCSDYWTGVDLREMDDVMLKKISDFYQTAIVNDMQCVAYAYRPIAIEDGQELPSFESRDPGFITLPYLPRADGLDPNASNINAKAVAAARRAYSEPSISMSVPDEIIIEVDDALLEAAAEKEKNQDERGETCSGRQDSGTNSVSDKAKKASEPQEDEGEMNVDDQSVSSTSDVFKKPSGLGDDDDDDNDDENDDDDDKDDSDYNFKHDGGGVGSTHHTGSSVESSIGAPGKVEASSLQRWRKLRQMRLLADEEDLNTENNNSNSDPFMESNHNGTEIPAPTKLETELGFSKDAQPTDEEFCKKVVQGQIFLGMATLAHQPKTNVCDFIEDLGLAGIRFVYFSPSSERESKAFADRLGLETDWNSCILLSSASDPNGAGTGYLESYDIKAQLPRGIENIRPHLETVDDIPLHVSLFAESGDEAATEMIRIFQDYGEVVCCIGSSLNMNNLAAFATADIGVGMEPIRMHAGPESKSSFSLAAKINALPCGLMMQNDTSLYALTQIIREARRLLNSQRQGMTFMMASFLSISLLMLVSYCFLLPPALTGYQILWLMWVIVPILILSFFFSPHEPDTMTMMPSKNTAPLKDLPRFVCYFFLRFSLPTAMCIFVFLYLLYIYDNTGDFHFLFNSFGDGLPWLDWTDKEQWALLYAQNYTLLVWVWYAFLMSSSFVSRTLSFKTFPPWKNRVWIGAGFACLVFQIIFCAVSIYAGPHSINKVPWWVHFLAFACWPILFLPIQEVVKAHDLKECIRAQKRAKLDFTTKLGMHSPL